MSADRVRQEAELLAQAVAQQFVAGAQEPAGRSDDPDGSFQHAQTAPPSGWAELLAGAALAARGGLDLLGAAVTRLADGTAPRGSAGRGDVFEAPFGRAPWRTPSGPGAASYDESGDEPSTPAFHRAPRRTIPVRDGDAAGVDTDSPT